MFEGHFYEKPVEFELPETKKVLSCIISLRRKYLACLMSSKFEVDPDIELENDAEGELSLHLFNFRSGESLFIINVEFVWNSRIYFDVNEKSLFVTTSEHWREIAINKNKELNDLGVRPFREPASNNQYRVVKNYRVYQFGESVKVESFCPEEPIVEIGCAAFEETFFDTSGLRVFFRHQTDNQFWVINLRNKISTFVFNSYNKLSQIAFPGKKDLILLYRVGHIYLINIKSCKVLKHQHWTSGQISGLLHIFRPMNAFSILFSHSFTQVSVTCFPRIVVQKFWLDHENLGSGFCDGSYLITQNSNKIIAAKHFLGNFIEINRFHGSNPLISLRRKPKNRQLFRKIVNFKATKVAIQFEKVEPNSLEPFSPKWVHREKKVPIFEPFLMEIGKEATMISRALNESSKSDFNILDLAEVVNLSF